MTSLAVFEWSTRCLLVLAGWYGLYRCRGCARADCIGYGVGKKCCPDCKHHIYGMGELLRVAERVREACEQTLWGFGHVDSRKASQRIRAIAIKALLGEREES